MADLPIWGAFQDAIDRNVQRGSANLQQMGALQGILAQQQNVQKQQAAAMREREFRGALAAARTPEERMAVAEKYADPSQLLAHGDRQATAANTKELALARLAQTAQQGEQMFKLRMAAATTAADKARVDAEYKGWTAAVARERLKYDTGATLPPFAPSLMPAQAAEEGATFNFRLPNGQTLAGSAPNEAAAVGIGQAALGASPAAPAALSAAPAPQEAPAPAPAMPNNMDTQDMRLAAAPQAAAPAMAPAAAPALPAMPQFVGSPREQAAAKNKWLMAQAKGGEAGGKATDATVTAVLEGRMQPPTGFALRSPYWQDVMERVNAKDPKFEGGKYASRAAAMRTFASGPEARNVTALNTVIGHLGTLDEAATALQNGDIRAFNAVANRLATETGDPRVQNFDTARQAVAEETMRVFRQVGASEREAREWGDRIQSSGSPQQLKGVIATLGKLLDSRVEAINQQYQRTVNSQGSPAKVDPANRTVLDKLIEKGSAPSWDKAKEDRYQELRRKLGGS